MMKEEQSNRVVHGQVHFSKRHARQLQIRRNLFDLFIAAMCNLNMMHKFWFDWEPSRVKSVKASCVQMIVSHARIAQNHIIYLTYIILFALP